MNDIEISKSNYKDYSLLDIVAFSYAVPGAMGEWGGLYMITSDGNVYHTNVVDSDMELEDAFVVCPPFKDCHFGVIGAVPPKGWSSRYMGFGNHLFVKDEILKQIKDKCDGLHRCDLYLQWEYLVLSELHG